MLERPQPLPVSSAEEVVFSKAKYGSVKRAFVVLEKDQAVPKQVQEGMIEKNPPNRVELIGDSDHMVMASQPAKLVACLLAIVQDLS